METKWHVSAGGLGILNERNESIGIAHQTDACFANARLIAAAPEMLEMLKEASLKDENGNYMSNTEPWQNKRRALLARIAKG